MRIFALTILLTLLALPALAEQRPVGKFGDWQVFSGEENGAPICFMLSKPIKQEGKFKKRGTTYATITQRPAENSLDVVSFVAGYDFKDNMQPKLSIGRETFTLFTRNDTAWARDAVADKAVLAAIRRGNQMVLQGESERGTKITDTYSLKGTSKAIEAMNKACGLR